MMSPVIDPPPLSPRLLMRISSTAPAAPSSTPPVLSGVIGSRRKNIARIIVRMGTVVAMIETLIGEVRESPQRKRIWSSWMPKSEATNSPPRSRQATRSRGRKADASQKSRKAPTRR